MDLNKTPGVLRNRHPGFCSFPILSFLNVCIGNPGEMFQGGSPTETFGDDKKKE